MDRFPPRPVYNVRVTPERPDYKSHPLWEEAMRLVREAYGLADELRGRDPEAALGLRKAAVSVPARVAGALSARQAAERDAEASGARAALAEVAARAERASGGRPSDLSQHARKLELSVALELASQQEGWIC
jgi:four helix bundle protein